jgi:Putative prokaryotic signal transducing protein
MSTRPNADPELVEVFDTAQESEAMVVHGLLTSAGIESIITNLEAPQDVLPGVGGISVRVNQADQEEARRVIEEYRNNAAAEVDQLSAETEEDVSGTV